MLDKFDKKTNPFKVPETYFEGFNRDIMLKLPEKENKVTKKVVPMWKKVVPWGAVAAIFTTVILTTGILNTEPVVKSNDAEFVLEEEYYSFLEEQTMSSAYSDYIYSVVE